MDKRVKCTQDVLKKKIFKNEMLEFVKTSFASDNYGYLYQISRHRNIQLVFSFENYRRTYIKWVFFFAKYSQTVQPEIICGSRDASCHSRMAK